MQSRESEVDKLYYQFTEKDTKEDMGGTIEVEIEEYRVFNYHKIRQTFLDYYLDFIE